MCLFADGAPLPPRTATTTCLSPSLSLSVRVHQQTDTSFVFDFAHFLLFVFVAVERGVTGPSSTGARHHTPFEESEDRERGQQTNIKRETTPALVTSGTNARKQTRERKNRKEYHGVRTKRSASVLLSATCASSTSSRATAAPPLTLNASVSQKTTFTEQRDAASHFNGRKQNQRSARDVHNITKRNKKVRGASSIRRRRRSK